MGLLSKLTAEDGSTLSFSDGKDPLINPLAGGGFNDKNTSLHYNSYDLEPGYSVNGNQFSIVNSNFQQYEDGKNTPLPPPTELDLLDPINVDPNYKPKYTSIPGQTYSDLYNKF
jgi:hypothetical protein